MIIYKDNKLGSKGVNKKGEELFFFEDSKIKLEDGVFSIPDSSIILRNGLLQTDGCLCVRNQVSQQIWGVIIEEQEFYKVVMSSRPEIPIGSMLVIKENSAYKFNLSEEKEVAFIHPSNIILHASLEGGFKAGTDFLMLATDFEYENRDLAEQINYAHNENETYYFEKYSHRMWIKGKLYIFVKKQEVKIVTPPKNSSSYFFSSTENSKGFLTP